jgi:tetratricopeptide (TPR) repeat protein
MRMALCKKNVGDSDSALALIKSVLDSPSSLVRCLADYQYAIIEMQKGRFLNTRTRACQALALLSDIALPDDLSMRLSRNCNFLADQALLQHILAISAAGAESPRQLYNEIYDLDPLKGLNDTQLESLVSSGSDLLAKGLLGPKINRLQQSTDAVARWNVYCSGASVEELLANFASSNSFELLWKFLGTDSAEDGARKRAVFLCMSNATAEQIVNVAAGSAGLVAFIDANNLITATRPDEYSSLNAHINLLAKYSITLWQQFLLRFPKDSRTPDSHFALGLLKALCGEVPDALAEYKIVANRYPRTFLAPYALLNSAALRTSLKDYLGARQDLMQLTEQYPDVPIAEQAIFNLANAAMNASMFNQALLLYQKLYFLTSSEKFKADSAYSAAKCSYQLDNPQDTIHWAGEFIKLVNDKSDQRVSYACYLLGKASFSLEKFADAYSAFNNALDADIPPEDYINILSTLVNAYIQKDSLLEAMAVVETARNKQLPPIQNIQLMLLKCAVLRKMGFADKALASLNQMDEFIDQPQLKAQVLFESAQCLIALNRFEPARRNLTQFIVIAEKNSLFDQACLDLADVCLMLGQCDNAISTCKQLIDSKPLPSIKQKALVIMASAYKQKKNYDKAALALADNSRQETAARK